MVTAADSRIDTIIHYGKRHNIQIFLMSSRFDWPSVT